ncbi:MAG: phosphoribosylanthranilate isomerase [Chloroflexota bacterium]
MGLDIAIKICGLSTSAHAIAAVEAGVDMIGLMFAPSRRQVSPKQAAMLTEAVRSYQRHMSVEKRVSFVGVFVNEDVAHMASIADYCGLDSIQLSGDEDVSIVGRLPNQYDVIKAIRLTDAVTERQWLTIDRQVRFLVDAHVANSYGGSGVTADWAKAAIVAQQHEILLAGGLSSTNVAEAVRVVHPWGVDVSSGVESNGIKDAAKIRSFVATARTMSGSL